MDTTDILSKSQSCSKYIHQRFLMGLLGLLAFNEILLQGEFMAQKIVPNSTLQRSLLVPLSIVILLVLLVFKNYCTMIILNGDASLSAKIQQVRVLRYRYFGDWVDLSLIQIVSSILLLEQFKQFGQSHNRGMERQSLNFVQQYFQLTKRVMQGQNQCPNTQEYFLLSHFFNLSISKTSPLAEGLITTTGSCFDQICLAPGISYCLVAICLNLLGLQFEVPLAKNFQKKSIMRTLILVVYQTFKVFQSHYYQKHDYNTLSKQCKFTNFIQIFQFVALLIGLLQFYMTTALVLSAFITVNSSYQQSLSALSDENEKLSQNFKNMLDKIPNGILIYDLKLKGYSYLNKDMKGIIDISCNQNQHQMNKLPLTSAQIPDRLSNFHIFEKVSDGEVETNVPLTESHTRRKEAKQEKSLINLQNAVVSTRKFSVLTSSQGGASSSNRTNHQNDKLNPEVSGQIDKDSKSEEFAFNGRVARGSQKQNLHEYLMSIAKIDWHEIQESEEIFKKKREQCYIQIKTSKFQEGRQIFAICTDITRIMQMENQEKQMRATFFSSVAHELRTPLNSIIPILRLILQILPSINLSNAPHQKIVNYIKIILNSSLHLESLIEDALDISRIENNNFSLYMEMFNLRDAIGEIRDIMAFQVEQKKLSFSVYIQEGVPDQMWLDRKRFKQVLFNLIGNAIKFTFFGGITLSVKFDNQNKTLQTEVNDTGIGIKADDLAKLFKFFGKLPKSMAINRGGMGLGLTISKMIIKQLDGQIDVKSEPDIGTTFMISLPISTFEFVPKQGIKQDGVQAETQQLNRSQTINDSNDSLELNPFKVKLQFEKISLGGRSSQSLEEITSNGREWVDDNGWTNNYRELTSQQSQHLTDDLVCDGDQSQNDSFLFQNISHPQFIHFAEGKLCKTMRQITNSSEQIEEKKEYNYEQIQEESKLAIEDLKLESNSQSQKQIKILSVDDSAYNLFVLKELLSVCEPGIEVTEALNGKIALEEYRKRHYDIIFMDLNMPVIDGFQVILTILTQNLDCQGNQGYVHKSSIHNCDISDYKAII
ncbi:hypothetical protein FGO68_gene10112 [Halteria grandinella]|uniref:histidine kinase n=1 Tax=Halteria grandinella TaxID=5974 RepID=A0A8J8P0H5_HALGN|nr:hypothetical protein FGO68_gene10112 [Halteria grandinella]